MSDKSVSDRSEANGWDSYWKGTNELGAFSGDGVNHPVISAYWENFCESVRTGSEINSVLDVATGNGALLPSLLNATGAMQCSVTCFDYSLSAIQSVKSKYPNAQAFVGDARRLPILARSVDLVTSQFGVEYAGMAAIEKVSGLVSEQGQLSLMMHMQNSSIYQDCENSYQATISLIESDFLNLADLFFQAAFAAFAGGERAPYDAAATRLQPAVTALESSIAKYDVGVASGMMAHLHGEVAKIHSSMQNYQLPEVLAWLRNLATEMPGYAERMKAMRDSALDESEFEQLKQFLVKEGFKLPVAHGLKASGEPLPLAWVLQASR